MLMIWSLFRCYSTYEKQTEIVEINNIVRKVGTEKNQVTASEINEWIVGDEDHSDESNSELPRLNQK